MMISSSEGWRITSKKKRRQRTVRNREREVERLHAQPCLMEQACQTWALPLNAELWNFTGNSCQVFTLWTHSSKSSLTVLLQVLKMHRYFLLYKPCEKTGLKIVHLVQKFFSVFTVLRSKQKKTQKPAE